jgi:Protein of unknown function (DUF3800)
LYRVYIDEAGDRGHGPGSSVHFMVAAVVVQDQDDAVVRGQLTALRTELGRQPGHTLHFRKLTHSQKIKACQDIAGFAIDTITTLTMVKPRFNEPLPEGGATLLRHANPMYLWAIRLVLERVSWYVHAHGGGPAIVTFGHLTRFPTVKLHNYREALELSPTEIRWHVFQGHPFRVDHPNNIELLQVADSAASALFKAVEQDQYGNREDRYLTALAPKLYRRGTAYVTSYGLKVFPKSECEKGGTLEFLRHF